MEHPRQKKKKVVQDNLFSCTLDSIPVLSKSGRGDEERSSPASTKSVFFRNMQADPATFQVPLEKPTRNKRVVKQRKKRGNHRKPRPASGSFFNSKKPIDGDLSRDQKSVEVGPSRFSQAKPEHTREATRGASQNT